MFDIIVAVSKNWVIGKNNDIPWKSKEDMKYFRKVTTGGIIIMGYKTFQSIGRKLPNRINIVINREINGDKYSEVRDDIFHVGSLTGAFNLIGDLSPGNLYNSLGIQERVTGRMSQMKSGIIGSGNSKTVSPP